MARERCISLLLHSCSSPHKPGGAVKNLCLRLCSSLYVETLLEVKNGKWLRKQRFHAEPKDVAYYPKHKRKSRTFLKIDSPELFKYLHKGSRCTRITHGVLSTPTEGKVYIERLLSRHLHRDKEVGDECKKDKPITFRGRCKKHKWSLWDPNDNRFQRGFLEYKKESIQYS